MPLADQLRHQIRAVFGTAGDEVSRADRLMRDAVRLWDRVGRLTQLVGLTGPLDVDALELACYALRLSSGRPGARDRFEQSAELLVNLLAAAVEPSLLDQTTRLLLQAAPRKQKTEESRLLSDAVNLDDFGVAGLMRSAMEMASHGAGVAELAATLEKREQYGYWEARLKSGFHFEAARKVAVQRLANAREMAKLLQRELREEPS